ncbi:glycosyltransferase family protein [Methanobrevibacter boviskoreani]|uniref:glycosyltransferase family protein n=1 Tax=Methanobrevibacter boviskoreani TaxID=1348249 RepID=UPI0023F57F8E|nr:glycosyltransferase [Methanobrevibacter boviskoreani]MDD6257190.1 glycosyltransferase [Methanobrevibacter boviskoreani]
MDEDYDYLTEKYRNLELEDKVDKLKKENKTVNKRNFQLNKENLNLKKENNELFKKNQHFKSTKAYKVWIKYATIKDKIFPNKDNKSPSNKKIEKSNLDFSNKPIKNLKDIKVAIIADQFTYDSYKYEFKAILINPDDWQEKFRIYKPDLFFCESAWDGIASENNEKPWRNKIFKRYDYKDENRKELLKILEYCKNNNIPTIFWNKEDPVHYRTEIWSYADTASEFDYIFTSSEECIKRYKKDYNHPNVYCLMFAGQPKLFNPLNLSNETIEYPVFAGAYYGENHPQRTEKMNMIFDKVIEEWGDLIIFDRNYYKQRFDYPEKYQKYVRPAIKYEETALLYKKMKWGLNLNIVTNSNTMFARRVFELSLTNTLILTNYSKAVERIFRDNVFFFDKMDKLPDFNGSYMEKRMNNLYNVLENHTYTNRFKQILDTIGYPYSEDVNDITIIFKSDSTDNIEKIIDSYDKIDYPDKKLNIIILDKSANINNIKSEYPEIDDIQIEDNDLYDYIHNLNSEFIIILKDITDNDFISKGILHYKYLNKKISIAKGPDKFTLGQEDDITNKIINKEVYTNLSQDIPIDVYYI